jgi:hypothetical protein
MESNRQVWFVQLKSAGSGVFAANIRGAMRAVEQESFGFKIGVGHL